MTYFSELRIIIENQDATSPRENEKLEDIYLHDSFDPSALSTTLHFILTMMVEGTPLDMVHHAGSGQGIEAWRKIITEYDPKLATRIALPEGTAFVVVITRHVDVC